MSKLQKKCFVASTTMHALLMSLLFVAPAFLTPEKKFEEIPVVTMIPNRLIDDPAMGGGGQKAPAPTPKPAEALPPQSQPPAVAKEKEAQPPPEPTPTPARPEPKVIKSPKPIEPEPKKNPEKTPPKPIQPANEKPKKTEIQPSLRRESDLSPKDKAAKARADAAAKAKQQAQYASALEKVRQGLDRNLSSATTGIEMPDLGGVGEAYANWAWVVVKIFEDAWTPHDVADNDSTVKVSVTIERTGRVRNFNVIQKSGSSALDKSVLRALEGVKSVPAFPEGAKDYERTLKLNFNLKSKRLSG